jgi:hypothetical protein
VTKAVRSDDLRNEADRLLDAGLRTILSAHGDVHVIGSYALDLMTWRDLDIHMVREPIDVADFFLLGSRIESLLHPPRLHFRNEIAVRTPGLPHGVYWGVYLGDERAGAWKIDIWLTDAAGFEPVRTFGDNLSARLTDETRRAILDVKQAAWRHPEYRRGFTSSNIYSAVLDRGVRDANAFWQDLEATTGIRRSASS